MSTRIIWLGHGTFSIETGGKTVIIDPFFTGNPAATTTAESVSPDAMIISHGHGDHVGDAVEIAKRSGCLVVANYEITEWLTKQGVENVHPQHIGGSHKHDFGTVKLTIAHHGSSLPDGSNGGNPCGIILKTDDGTIYHACDTGLFYDMKLIGEEGIDLAILPIGDNFTMGPEDALKAVNLINPKRVIPNHFDTWPLISQDADHWSSHVNSTTSTKAVVLTPSESTHL